MPVIIVYPLIVIGAAVVGKYVGRAIGLAVLRAKARKAKS